MRWRTLGLLGIVVLTACGPLAGCTTRDRRVRVRKTVIAHLPPGWRRPSINIADDASHLTVTEHATGGFAVQAPNGRGPVYLDVSPPLFAAGSTKVSYWALIERPEGRGFVPVIDGAEVASPFARAGTIVSAPGAKRWAVWGLVGAAPQLDAAMLVDGRLVGRYADVSHPGFSPDGRHVAWIGRDRSGRVSLVVDEQPVRDYPPREGEVVGNEPPTPIAFGDQYQVRYLSDGRLLVVAHDAEGWAVFREGERLASYGQNLVAGGPLMLGGAATPAGIAPASLVTAARAPVALWWERVAGEEEQWRVVRDGVPVDDVTCGRFWNTQPPEVTADGVHVAYMCAVIDPSSEIGQRIFAVLDGRRFGPYYEAWTMGIAEDGSAVAYGAGDTLPVRKWRIYVNGVARTPPHELVWRPRLSPDGRHAFWAVGEEHGQRAVGIDDQRVAYFDDVLFGPEFPNATTAVWVIRHGRKVARLDVRF